MRCKQRAVGGGQIRCFIERVRQHLVVIAEENRRPTCNSLFMNKFPTSNQPDEDERVVSECPILTAPS
eukprot:COSAG06_NODE_2341_length_7051_cov_73.733458_8_plen_68_part_00